MVNQDLVELKAADIVVVHSGQDGVDAAARRNDGNVRTCSSKISDNGDLICQLCTWASVVCQHSSSGLVDELKNLESSLLRRGLQSLFLCIGEIRRYGDDGGIDVLAQVVRSRFA